MEKKPLAPRKNAHGVNKFYNNCNNEQTIYVKIDDDIIWLEENFIKNILDFRVDNPEYFLVCGNIINNAICDHIHQKISAIPDHPHISYSSWCPVGWTDSAFAEKKHEFFLNALSKKDINRYKFDGWVLFRHERISINCISWFGVWPRL